MKNQERKLNEGQVIRLLASMTISLVTLSDVDSVRNAFRYVANDEIRWKSAEAFAEAILRAHPEINEDPDE